MATFNFDSNTAKKDPFLVPDNYFENFSANILFRIRKEHNTTHDAPFIKWIPLIGAACITVMFMIFMQQTDNFSDKLNSPETFTEQINDSYEDEIYDYMFADNNSLISYDNYE